MRITLPLFVQKLKNKGIIQNYTFIFLDDVERIFTLSNFFGRIIKIMNFPITIYFTSLRFLDSFARN